MKKAIKNLNAERLGLITIILLGYTLRLLWVHNPGCVVDTRGIANWMRSASQGGLLSVLESEEVVYPPFTMYALWALGELLSPKDPVSPNPTIPEVLGLRLLTIFFEVLTIVVVYRIGKHAGSWGTALLAALLYAANPVAIYLSGWWGQIEVWFTLPLSLAIWWLSSGKSTPAWALLTLAALLKQPAIIALPLAIVATYRWMKLRKLVTGLTVLIAGSMAAMTPIVLQGKADLFLKRLPAIRQIFPWISLRSYNLWFLLTPRARSIGLDLNHDHGSYIAGVSFHDWGLLLLAIGYGLVLTRILARAKPRDLLAACGICWLVYFTVSTRIHARYLYTALVLFLLAGQFNRKWLWFHLALTATMTLNVFSRACEISPATCLGPFLASGPLSLTAAAVNVVLLVLAFIFLFRQTNHTKAWKGTDAVHTHRALVRLGWAAFAGLALLSAYEASKLSRQASNAEVTLTESLNTYLDQSNGTKIVVNFPREVQASSAGAWQVLPVTPPSRFPPPGVEPGSELMHVQYEPWQATSERSTQITYSQYQGRLETWADLAELAQRADSVIAVNPYSHRAYNLVESVPAAPTQIALFGDGVILTEAAAAMEDEYLILVLGWRATGQLTQDATVFVHLVDGTGAVISQADGAPGRDLFPLAHLARSGIAVRETRIVPITLDPVEVLVGVYEQDSQSRLPAHCSPELSCPDDALRIRLSSEQ